MFLSKTSVWLHMYTPQGESINSKRSAQNQQTCICERCEPQDTRKSYYEVFTIYDIYISRLYAMFGILYELTWHIVLLKRYTVLRYGFAEPPRFVEWNRHFMVGWVQYTRVNCYWQYAEFSCVIRRILKGICGRKGSPVPTTMRYSILNLKLRTSVFYL